MQQLIEQALAHIVSIHPSVTQVVYDDDLRWRYSDSNGAPVKFNKTEDIYLLETAADEAYDRGLQNVAIVVGFRPMPELCRLWNELADTPADDGCLETAFLHFDAGTQVEDVWHWFEEQNPAFEVAKAGATISGSHPFLSVN